MNNCSFSVLNTDVFGKVSVWWQPQASWPVCDRYPWEQGPAPTFPCTPRPWLRSLASFRCWGCLRCKSFQIEHQNRILLDSELVCKMWVKLWCNWKCPNQAASLLLTLWPYQPHMGKWDLADHINWALKGEGAEGREDPSLQICHLLLPRLSSLPHPWSYWSIHRSLRMFCAKAQAYKPCADASEGLPLLQLEISSMNWRKEERREEIKQEKKEGRNGGREGRREGWWEGGMERGEEGRKKVRKKWRKGWKVRTMTAFSPGPLWTNRGSRREEDGPWQGRVPAVATKPDLYQEVRVICNMVCGDIQIPWGCGWWFSRVALSNSVAISYRWLLNTWKAVQHAKMIIFWIYWFK